MVAISISMLKKFQSEKFYYLTIYKQPAMMYPYQIEQIVPFLFEIRDAHDYIQA